jgi:asparagine synthase (glutamine-hydrolysing)
MLHGEIHNLPALRGGLPAAAEDGPGAVLLAHLLAHGPEGVADLRGVFSILVYDALEHRLMLLTDHFGSRPLYVMEDGDRLLFGSEKKFVLALRDRAAVLDPLGILQVVAHNHNLGTRTFVEGLRSLPGHAALTADAGGVAIRRTGYLGFPEPLATGFDEAAATWAGNLRESVRRCLEGKDRVVLQLSGGLDSRAIAAAIPRERRPLTALTRMTGNRLEVETARALASRLGLEHHVSAETASPGGLIPAIVWRTEGTLAHVHCRSIENHGFLAPIADHLMGGQFGGISSGGQLAPYMSEPADAATFRGRVFAHYSIPRAALARVFTEAFLARHHPDLEAEFRASFDGVNEASNVNTYQVWDQIERQTNMIMRAGLVNRHLVEGVYPLLDLDYFAFARAMPERWRSGQLVYRAAIHRIGPEIRDVPSANDGARMRASEWANRLDLAAHKRLRALRGALRDRLRRAAPRQASASVDAATAALIRGFLASPACDGAIFDRAGIEALVAGQGSALPERAYLLAGLATFAAAIPMFLDAPPTDCPEAARGPLSRPA